MRKESWKWLVICILFVSGLACKCENVLAASLPESAILQSSDDYEEILTMQEQIAEEVKECIPLYYNDPEKEIPAEIDIDFSRCYKVYVDTEILSLESEAEIKGKLEESKYIWELFLQIDGEVWTVTIARGLDYDSSNSDVLTEEQKQELKDNAGKWTISEISAGCNYPDYSDTVSESCKDLKQITDIILVGNQKGFQQPIGIAFAEGKAKYIIDLGLSYPDFLFDREDSVYEGARICDRVYDYQTLSALVYENNDTKSVEESGGGAGTVAEASGHENSPVRCLVIFLLIGAVALTGGVMIRKRNIR